jgi:quercetin dioxygenase-like cupin family protein
VKGGEVAVTVNGVPSTLKAGEVAVTVNGVPSTLKAGEVAVTVNGVPSTLKAGDAVLVDAGSGQPPAPSPNATHVTLSPPSPTRLDTSSTRTNHTPR